jgi:hypothetical protein
MIYFLYVISTKNLKPMFGKLRIIYKLVNLLVKSFSNEQKNASKTNNIVVNIKESTKFSKEKIQSAASCVINKFKDLIIIVINE